MGQRALACWIAVALLAGACTDLAQTEVTAAVAQPDSSTRAFGNPGDAAIAAARTSSPDLENAKVTRMIAIYADASTVDLRVQVEADRFCHWYGVSGHIREARLEWRAGPAGPC
jgi:hypothetical protein